MSNPSFNSTTSDNVAITQAQRVDRYTQRGIVLPAAARDPFVLWGTIVAVGPGRCGPKTGIRHPMTVVPGDKALYLREAVRSSFDDVVVNGIDHDKVAVVQERDINAVLRDRQIIPLNDYVIGQIIPAEYDFETITMPDGSKKTWYGKYVDVNGKQFFIPSVSEDEDKEKKETRPIRVRATQVGPGRRSDNGNVIPMDVAEGDIILVSKYMAWEFIIDDTKVDEGYVVVKSDQIFGVEAA